MDKKLSKCAFNINEHCKNPNCNVFAGSCDLFCKSCTLHTERDVANCIWHSREDNRCGYYMPESCYDCEELCEHFEERVDIEQVKEEFNKMEENEKEVIKIEGVGKDAEIVENERGGKQSKAPMAAHLLDPKFLQYLTKYGSTIHYIADFMEEGSRYSLEQAICSIEENAIQAVIRIAKTLQEGASKYEPNNWRLIPQEEHINHALIHLFAAELGDTQDNHLDHALTRIMMAYATELSPNFSYTEYIKKKVA